MSDDGRMTTVEKNLKPNENLSLRQFIKETENVSECDVIQVSDDDLEDLPRDNVPVKAKVMSCTGAFLKYNSSFCHGLYF